MATSLYFSPTFCPTRKNVAFCQRESSIFKISLVYLLGPSSRVIKTLFSIECNMHSLLCEKLSCIREKSKSRDSSVLFSIEPVPSFSLRTFTIPSLIKLFNCDPCFWVGFWHVATSPAPKRRYFNFMSRIESIKQHTIYHFNHKCQDYWKRISLYLKIFWI